MVDRMKTAEDVDVCKDALVNFIGHRNLISQTILDKFMYKSLEIGQADKMHEIIKFHSELLYHP